jgi:hypothetical protein
MEEVGLMLNLEQLRDRERQEWAEMLMTVASGFGRK